MPKKPSAPIRKSVNPSGNSRLKTVQGSRFKKIRSCFFKAHESKMVNCMSASAAAQHIERQLCGRCARQRDPGSVRYYASLEDELLRQYGLKPFSKLLLQTIKKRLDLLIRQFTCLSLPHDDYRSNPACRHKLNRVLARETIQAGASEMPMYKTLPWRTRSSNARMTSLTGVIKSRTCSQYRSI